MTNTMTNAVNKAVNANTNEVRVCYEDSNATHVYYVRNIEFEDFDDGSKLEQALNEANFGKGEFCVEVYTGGHCNITYMCNAMNGETGADFAIDLEEKLSEFLG